MEDKLIIEMLNDRDEKAIEELSSKYGGFCRSIALRLLGDSRDAEECVSDAFLAAWQNIPPENPKNLSAYLGKIIRNNAVSRIRAATAEKRKGEIAALLSELEECLPSKESTEERLESKELGEYINQWLKEQSEPDRAIFILRYWHGYTPKEISLRAHQAPTRISHKLFCMRQKLRKAMENQGVII